ncbi:MAG: BatD family protein [Bacteriovoracaceae bacterium]|nr:BatD family protein [Bacteroidota bacterium]
MSNRIGKISTAFFMLVAMWTWNVLFAQDVSFTAGVDKNPVAADEQFTLEFTVTTSGASPKNFRTPDFGKVLVLSGPNQSTSMQIINGSVTSSQTFSYILQAREPGKMTIGAATIEISGNQYKSNPIELTVTKSSGKKQQQAKSAQGEAVDIGDNLFLRAIVDRSRVYQGEQITVTYKIYTRARIVNYSINKLPTMTGFWGEELQLPQQVSLSNEVINGKQYQVGVLKKMALFPTQSGSLDINPMELTCQVQVQSRRRSNDIFDQFFNDPFFGAQTANVPLKSDPVKVTVLPLPQSPVPESFQGAVGKFTLTASLNKRRSKTNEPISLKATISGSGNVKILEAPKLHLPSDFEQYDPKVKEDIERTGSAISGTKTFEWLIVPRYPGDKKIPALEFSYFDVGQRRYVTLRTNEFNVVVEKGSAEAPQTASGLSKEDVRLLNQDIRFIKTDAGSFHQKDKELFDPVAAATITVIPFVAFLGLMFYRQKALSEMSDVVTFRSRKALKIAAKKLANAKQLMNANNSEAFYAEVSTAMWQYVSDKLSIDRAELSIDNVTQTLQEKRVSAELTQKIKELLEACEFSRFAPGSSSQEEKNKMYEMASSIIVASERELVR